VTVQKSGTSWLVKSARDVPISDMELLTNRFALILECSPADGINAGRRKTGLRHVPLALL
jgi:hypothetical protein